MAIKLLGGRCLKREGGELYLINFPLIAQAHSFAHVGSGWLGILDKDQVECGPSLCLSSGTNRCSSFQRHREPGNSSNAQPAPQLVA